MRVKNATIQKVFAGINIFMSMPLMFSGVMLLSEIGAYGLISVAIGLTLLVIGFLTLRTYRKYADDAALVKKIQLLNTIAFVFSFLMLAACIILPIMHS